MSMCISTAQARTNSAPRALLDLCLSHLCEDIHAGARNHTHQNLTPMPSLVVGVVRMSLALWAPTKEEMGTNGIG